MLSYSQQAGLLSPVVPDCQGCSKPAAHYNPKQVLCRLLIPRDPLRAQLGGGDHDDVPLEAGRQTEQTEQLQRAAGGSSAHRSDLSELPGACMQRMAAWDTRIFLRACSAL